MLSTIAGIIAPIVLIVLAGYLYAKRYNTDIAVANRLTIDVFVPALLFSVLIDQDLNLSGYTELTLGAVAIILISGAIAWVVAKLGHMNYKTFVPPMMYANSGNIGLPLALLAFGEAAIPTAIILFIIENSLHFTLGVKTLNRDASIISVLRIPMVWASILGLGFNTLELTLPDVLLTPLSMVGEIAIPLMLFALGVRLVDINAEHWRIGLIGAIIRPLSGVIALVLVLPWLELTPLNSALLVVFAVLPPAVLNFMVAEKYQQEVQKVAAIVLIGNVFALLSLSIALYYVLPTLN